MTTGVDDAAGSVIELTNSIGAAAAGLQNTTETARMMRRAMSGAAQHPERLAAAGVALILAAGVLSLRRPDPGSSALVR